MTGCSTSEKKFVFEPVLLATSCYHVFCLLQIEARAVCKAATSFFYVLRFTLASLSKNEQMHICDSLKKWHWKFNVSVLTDGLLLHKLGQVYGNTVIHH